MAKFVCQDATKYLKRIALKCQVLAVWEGGPECVQNIAMKWKDEGASLKDMEGPVIHPVNWNSSESEMTECVDKWQVDMIAVDGKGDMRGGEGFQLM